MSNVERFEELLRSDEALQAKLRAATEAYQGDKTDERAIFGAVVAPLAAIAGGERWPSRTPKQGCFGIGLGGGADACTEDAFGAGACLGLGIGILGF